MDTTNSIFDWLDSNPDLKHFNVPLMSDRCEKKVSQVLPFLLDVLKSGMLRSRGLSASSRGATQMVRWVASKQFLMLVPL